MSRPCLWAEKWDLDGLVLFREVNMTVLHQLLFSPPITVYPVSPYSLSHPICMFTRWSDLFVGAGRLAVQPCSSLSIYKANPDFFIPAVCLSLYKWKRFVAECFAMAVITILKRFVVSTELAGFSFGICCIIWSDFLSSQPLSAVCRGLCSLQRQPVRL